MWKVIYTILKHDAESTFYNLEAALAFHKLMSDYKARLFKVENIFYSHWDIQNLRDNPEWRKTKLWE